MFGGSRESALPLCFGAHIQMHLISSNGSSFKLTIVDYQFPDNTHDYWDSNWLLIQVDVTHPKGPWTAVDPCLLTFEVDQLASWLEQVHSNSNKKPYCSFTEPHLAFRIEGKSEGERVLRVYFELGVRPKWAFARGAGHEDLWVDFPLAEVDLLLAAKELRSDLAKYPQRVHWEPKAPKSGENQRET